jgi:hypothetical protein
MCKGAMIKPNAQPATLATRQAITKSSSVKVAPGRTETLVGGTRRCRCRRAYDLVVCRSLTFLKARPTRTSYLNVNAKRRDEVRSR